MPLVHLLVILVAVNVASALTVWFVLQGGIAVATVLAIALAGTLLVRFTGRGA